jgi:hypothetical protein
MTSNRFGLYGAVTVAGVAVSLVLSACGPQPAENRAAESVTAESTAPAARATATSSPAALATPSRTVASSAAAKAIAPSATVPAQPVAPAAPAAPAPVVSAQEVMPVAPVQAAPKVPAAPVKPALKAFTFPDGHISFSYPASWSVRTERGPGREGPPWQPVEAIVSDRTGAELFRVSSGANGVGCTAGPANRTVLDQASLPGMRQADGTTPMFGFIVERITGQDWYAMAAMNPRFLSEGEGGSHCTLLVMGNGGAFNRVIFDQPVYPEAKSAFPNRQAAKAWMATEQYAHLKALIMSLKYS